MKQIYRWVGAGMIAAVMLSACDVLNIEPTESLESAQVFSEPSSARAAVMGMYAGAQSAGAFGGVGTIAADFTADVGQFTGSFTSFQQIRDYAIDERNGELGNVWFHNFRTINRANEVLEGIGEVPGMSAEEKSRIRGEALFLRAISYHQLLKWFAHPYMPGQTSQLGVPLFLEATRGVGEQNERPRATVGEVYSQIVQDLQEAAGLLPPSYGTATETRGRATVGAARGFLARVHLFMHNWDQADSFAQQVIDSPTYTLAADPVEPFAQENTPEHVFAIQFRGDDNLGVNAAIGSFTLPERRGDIRIHPDLREAYEEQDLRRTDLMRQVDDIWWTEKYPSVTLSDNVPVMRVAEMYLIRAEALAEQGQLAAALPFLNAIRERANATPYTTDDFANAAEFIDLVLNERRLELAFEGHRRFDFTRRGRGIFAHTIAQTIDDHRIVWPIHARELEINPALVQNPGY